VVKCILGIVVGIILTAGLLLMAVGGVLLWGMNSIMPKIYDITGSLKTMLKNLHISDEGLKSMETAIASNSATIGAIAFALGVLLTAIAVLGYLSLCCFGAKCFIYVIIGIINVIILAMVILAIVYGAAGSQKVFSVMEKQLWKLVENFQGYNATNFESVIINVVQSQLHCCGLYNYTDFNNATKWFGKKAGYKFPLSCCESKNMRYVDINKCKETWESPSLNKGCYSSMKPEIVKYLNYAFMGLGIAIAIMIVLDALFILYCMWSNKKEK